MRRHPFFNGSIRRILLILLLIALVPVVLIQILIYYYLYRSRLALESQANLEVARGLAQTFEGYLRDVQRDEEAIGLTLSTSLLNKPQEIKRYLIVNAREYPNIDAFVWIDPQGNVQGTGDPSLVGLALANLSFYQQIISGQPSAVSDLITPADKKPFFLIARGFRDEAGILQGIIVAVADPNRLGGELTVARTQGGTLALIDRRGSVVYRNPVLPALAPGTHIPEASAAINRAQAGQETVGVVVSPVDHQRRVVATTPVRSIGWVVLATRPVADVATPIIRGLLAELTLLLLISALTFVVAFLTSRTITTPLQRLQRQAQAIGSGDFTQHIQAEGPAELHNLAISLQQMADELREREEERFIFLHTITHDLRTPLAAVRGHAELLEDEIGNPAYADDQREGVEAIVRSIDRMTDLIKDISETAQIAAGRLELVCRPVPLAPFVHELLERYRTIWKVQRIHLDIPEDLPPVPADAARLERILVNLISNALKYSPADSPVTVHAERVGAEVIISVVDHGAGIPPEEQQRLFEPFFRARGTRAKEGTGLGLYIVAQLVKAHGGRIWVESVPGIGSAFYVALPIGEEA